MNKYLIFFVGVVSVIFITSIRFDRRDLVKDNDLTNSSTLGDSKEYISIVEYYKGNIAVDSLNTPFTYRAAVPYLASKMPFKPMTALNIINVISLIISYFFLFQLLQFLKFNDIEKIIGSFLYIISFPLYYYGAIGYLDPVFILFITGGVYFLIVKNYTMTTLFLVMGTFVKETIIILLLLMILDYFLNSKRNRNDLVILTISGIAFVLVFGLTRKLIPISSNFLWIPNLDTFNDNIHRIRTFSSYLLSFGIPGILSTFFILRMKNFESIIEKRLRNLLVSGFILTNLLFVYAMFSAYSDGRFIWPSYVFNIPMALWFLRYSYENYRRRKVL